MPPPSQRTRHLGTASSFPETGAQKYPKKGCCSSCCCLSSATSRKNSVRRGKLSSPCHPCRIQSFSKWSKRKLVTQFLKYRRLFRRQRTGDFRSAKSVHGDGGSGTMVEDAGSEEIRELISSVSLDSAFCGSDSVEDELPSSPIFRWSPSEEEHIFVSHSEEDLGLALGVMRDIESCGFQCFSPERDFIAGQLIKPIATAVVSSRRIVLLLTRNYLDTQWCSFELQMSVWFMYECGRALIVPVLVDVEETEVPPCLATLSLVDMQRDPNYQKKLLSILKGPEVPVTKLMPFGNISHGLVWSYYLRYLKIILPSLSERISGWTNKEQCVDKSIPTKLYILVPASCFCLDKLESVDGRIDFAGRLDPIRRNSAGSVDRSYDLSVWNLRKNDGQVVQFVGEYPAIIDTLYLMDCQRSAGLNSHQRRKEGERFVRTLQRILETDGLNHCVQMVVYQDTDENGHVKPLSEILMPYVENDRHPPPPKHLPPNKAHNVVLQPVEERKES